MKKVDGVRNIRGQLTSVRPRIESLMIPITLNQSPMSHLENLQTTGGVPKEFRHFSNYSSGLSRRPTTMPSSFFKNGKFYELYNIRHQQLDLNFTREGRVDMRCCGVPEQSFNNHCVRSIDLCSKPGRVEQTERGLEKRRPLEVATSPLLSNALSLTWRVALIHRPLSHAGWESVAPQVL